MGREEIQRKVELTTEELQGKQGISIQMFTKRMKLINFTKSVIVNAK